MRLFIFILVLTICFAFKSEIKNLTAEKINITIQAKSPNEDAPIYIQTLEFGDNRKFIKGKDGLFKLGLEEDKVYSVYVGQKGMQTVLFNVNTYMEEILYGNFNFSINVNLDYKLTKSTKKIHDVEIITNEQNKPALLFKKKN